MSILVKNLFISLLFIQSATLMGQTVDELKNQLNQSSPDTNQVLILNELAWKYRKSDFKTGLKYANRALLLSQKLNYPSGIATAYTRAGIIYHNQRLYDQALNNFEEALNIELSIGNAYGEARARNWIAVTHRDNNLVREAIQEFEKSLNIFDQLDSVKYQATLCNSLGTCYSLIGDNQKAISYFLTALEIRIKLEDSKLVADSYLGIGNFYRRNYDYEKAVSYYGKAEEIYIERKDTFNLIKVYYNIGLSHRSDGKYQKAIEYFKSSANMAKKLGIKSGLTFTIKEIGRVFHLQKDYEQAFQYYQEAYQLAKQDDDQLGLIYTYTALGAYYRDTKQYEKQIEYSLRALKITKNEAKREILGNLATAYGILGDSDNFIKYHNWYVQYRDSSEQSYRASLNLRDAYESERNQRQLLEKDREIEQQAIARLAAETKQQNILIYALITGGILLTGLFLAIIRAYRARQRRLQAENELNHKEQEIYTLLRDQEMKSMSAMLEVQEAERNRIAQDLHDHLGSLLATVKLNFQSLHQQIDEIKKNQYEQTNKLLEQACGEVRRVAHDMASGVLKKFGLIAALQDLKTAVETSQRIEVDLVDIGFEEERLEASQEISIYRIIQELICNTLKHAQAKTITIQLFRRKDTLNLIFEDDGKGFEVNKTSEGLGLKNIQARISGLKGEIDIDSQPDKGKGVTFVINIPL